MAKVGEEKCSRCITMSLLITLPTKSRVALLLPKATLGSNNNGKKKKLKKKIIMVMKDKKGCSTLLILRDFTGKKFFDIYAL